MIEFYIVAFLSTGALVTAAEAAFAARPIDYKRAIPRDLGSLLVYFAMFQLVSPVTESLNFARLWPEALRTAPRLVRLIAFYVVEDFLLYWAHRMMHTPALWRTHKWHHAPTYMYWFAGLRTSLLHILIFNMTFVIAFPILNGPSTWLLWFVLTEHMLRNHWMHMNVTWNSTWLERVFVTPRSHHVHHSDNPAHYRSNFGALLTVWDHMFGTFTDPNSLKEELKFGIGESPSPVRLVIGV